MMGQMMEDPLPDQISGGRRGCLRGLIPILLAGCLAAVQAGEAEKGHLETLYLQHDGNMRRYALYVPENPAANLPLVIELHGGGVSIEDMTGESGHKSPYRLWMNLADREKFLVVYPEGLNGAYGKPTWNDCRADQTVSSTADDVDFLSTLIDRLAEQWNIDQDRVYVSGTSNGGLMALRLAVERPEAITAVAAVAAAMPKVSSCPYPQTPVSVLFMNGTKDNRLPWKGGVLSQPSNPDHGTVLSTPRSIQIWKQVNGTQRAAITCHYPNLDRKDGSSVNKLRFPNGRKDTEVVLYKITGGGHSAPSRNERYSRIFERYFGKQNHDIEMVREVWRFFRNQRRPTGHSPADEN